MFHDRVWKLLSSLLIFVPMGCADFDPDAGDERAEQPSVAAQRGAAASSSKPLPGPAARTILHEEVNEAENLFFTDDGRLFVSGAEDIYEIKRAADGTFMKTDHFDENCIVEGIVQHGNYLYGSCWGAGQTSYLIAGELTENPVFRIIAELEKGFVPNGMEFDPEGRLYVTDFGLHRIVRMTLATPTTLASTTVWASNVPLANGIKYRDGFMYVTLLNLTLTSEFVRFPLRADGSAGAREPLWRRALTVLDDIIPFEDGFIVTDFLKGTLIFWDAARGVYAETPKQTFFGPTSLAQGRPPMFTNRQLIVAEKGNLLIRDEKRGDLLSMYQLP